MDIKASLANLLRKKLEKLNCNQCANVWVQCLLPFDWMLSSFLQPLLALPAGQAIDSRFLALPIWPLSLYTVKNLQKTRSAKWPMALFTKHFTANFFSICCSSFSICVLVYWSQRTILTLKMPFADLILEWKFYDSHIHKPERYR